MKIEFEKNNLQFQFQNLEIEKLKINNYNLINYSQSMKNFINPQMMISTNYNDNNINQNNINGNYNYGNKNNRNVIDKNNFNKS